MNNSQSTPFMTPSSAYFTPKEPGTKIFEIDDSDYISLMQSGELKEEYCDLGRVFDDIEVLRSDSASPTLQAFVKVKPGKATPEILAYLNKRRSQQKDTRIFVKLWPRETGSRGDSNRWYIEPIVYRYLKEKLIDTGITPNIMEYVSTGYCSDLFSDASNWLDETNLMDWKRRYMGLENVTKQVVDAKWGKLEEKNSGPLDGKVILIEKGEGSSLEDLIKSSFLNIVQNGTPLLRLKDFKCILFQVGYTLDQMHRIGVKHNDLHAGNVWINKRSEVTMEYDFEDNSGTSRSMRMRTKYVAKLYDFDLSAFTDSSIINSYLGVEGSGDLCDLFSICHNPDPLFDWLTLTVIARSKIIDIIEKIAGNFTMSAKTRKIINKELKELVEFLDDIIIEEKLRDPHGDYYRFPGRYCAVPGADGCEDPGKPVPKHMMKSYVDLYEEGKFDDIKSKATVTKNKKFPIQ